LVAETTITVFNAVPLVEKLDSFKAPDPLP
jgi:hypothetical protein